jgi:hypothetical protein
MNFWSVLGKALALDPGKPFKEAIHWLQYQIKLPFSAEVCTADIPLTLSK